MKTVEPGDDSAVLARWTRQDLIDKLWVSEDVPRNGSLFWHCLVSTVIFVYDLSLGDLDLTTRPSSRIQRQLAQKFPGKVIDTDYLLSFKYEKFASHVFGDLATEFETADSIELLTPSETMLWGLRTFDR